MSSPDDADRATRERDSELVHQLSLMGPKEPTAKRWVLLRANRLVLSGLLLFGVLCTLLLANFVWPFGMRDLLTESTTIQTLFNTLLSGTILLVSVVVSINSIVLSQDLTSLETQQGRVGSAMKFQERVEAAVGVETCPPEPAAFLRLMLRAILDNVADIRALRTDRPDSEAYDALGSYLHFLEGYTNVVAERMDEADAGSIEVLIVGLTYDYAGAIHATRKLRTEYEDELTDEELGRLDHLVDILQLFSTGHEYFKSLFYMREFGKLTKSLLYVSLPVIVFISYVLLAVSAGRYPDASLPFSSVLTLSMTAAYSVALAPYVVLTAFVLRSATIATRSLAAGPFVLSRNRW